VRAIRSRSTSRFRRRADRFLATALVALTVTPGGPAAAASEAVLAALGDDGATLLAQSGHALPDLLTLDAVVNGQAGGDVFVRMGALGPEIEETALRRWRIVVPSGAAREYEGRRYVLIAALPGATSRIDALSQQIVLTIPPPLFEPNALALGAAGGTVLSPPIWSGFANYDVFGLSSKGTSYGSGLFELGASGPYGSGIVSALANTSKLAGTSERAVLLDADWRYDDPAGPRTLILGTAVGPSGAWGRSLRFSGVQYGTNFSLRPDLITYPLPVFPGSAAVPSTVDVLVNGSRVGAERVQPGPFSISNVPVVTGAGDVQLVVRDAFGQERVVTQPFYASRQLLKPGLEDFSVSAGTERMNYGTESFDYGSGFAAGYWRRGLSDQLTVEVLGEGDATARVFGGSVDFIPGLYGVVTLGAAGSSSGAGEGWLGLAGYEYQGRRFNLGVRSLWASADFRMPGDNGSPPLQRLSLANIGFNLGPAGTVGVAWIDQRYRGQPAVTTGSASYSANLSARLSLVVTVSRSVATTSQTTAFATLILALDDKTSAAADVQSVRAAGSTHTIGGATLQRTLGIGEGYGYRIRAATDDQYQAGAIYAGPYGRYGVDFASAHGVSAVRGEVAGGIGAADGVVFAARPIVDSFGIVRVDSAKGVAIYQNGSFAGRTDDEGVAVLTQLFPYARNRITIDDRDVPIEITLGAKEREVAPYYRSGVLIDFGARRVVNAIVEVRLPDGMPLPAGAEVRRSGSAATYPVGSGGEVFVADLGAGGEFLAEWAGGRCRFVVDAATLPHEPLPRVGPLACAATKE
jgi:outer membrane usher protein